MKALLTSGGVRNRTVRDALVRLLGKPIEEAGALFVPTGVHPFPGAPAMVADALHGRARSPLAGLGWRSLGVLELTALPFVEESAWLPAVRDADALLVWGGDVLFLADWMRRSGLAARLPELRAVYVGVSAGSMAACTTFVEVHDSPPRPDDGPLGWEDVVLGSPDGDVDRVLVTGRGAGLVDVAVIPHLDSPHHPDASLANARRWAARIPAPTYAIDDQSALAVVDGAVEVVSEGRWELFEPA